MWYNVNGCADNWDGCQPRGEDVGLVMQFCWVLQVWAAVTRLLLLARQPTKTLKQPLVSNRRNAK